MSPNLDLESKPRAAKQLTLERTARQAPARVVAEVALPFERAKAWSWALGNTSFRALQLENLRQKAKKNIEKPINTSGKHGSKSSSSDESPPAGRLRRHRTASSHCQGPSPARGPSTARQASGAAPCKGSPPRWALGNPADSTSEAV